MRKVPTEKAALQEGVSHVNTGDNGSRKEEQQKQRSCGPLCLPCSRNKQEAGAARVELARGGE